MTLLDTNVLVYALNADAPQHAASRLVVDAALDRRVSVALVPQVLLEMFAIVTDSRRFPNPLTVPLAWEQVEALMAGLPVVEVGRDALRNLGHRLAERQVAGAAVFDAFLGAQMRAHGIATVCTYDTGGFAGLPGIEALTPEALADRHGLGGQ